MDNSFKTSGFPELDEWGKEILDRQYREYGYPVNQNIALRDFYKWYVDNGLDVVSLNNVGDPFSEGATLLSSHKFEREVLQFFAPLYDFDPDDIWGMVTNSGTDGNNHGIYFGVKYLKSKSDKAPILYVSDEAHYSNMRLADLQNIELRLVPSDAMGFMIPEKFEELLDPTRPCLIVYAIGSTFKGVIDDQDKINAIIAKYPEMPVYRHLDAALFGGYLPFTKHRGIISRNKMHYDSISVSGHKFFGMDEPAGIFLTTKTVFESQTSYNIPYLNDNMKMISCSRSALSVLKFWWLIKKVGYDKWAQQAEQMLENTKYLQKSLESIGYLCWTNELSNTVFLTRPPRIMVAKYALPIEYEERFGGDLAHIVVMQHVTKERIDAFVEDLRIHIIPEKQQEVNERTLKAIKAQNLKRFF